MAEQAGYLPNNNISSPLQQWLYDTSTASVPATLATSPSGTLSSTTETAPTGDSSNTWLGVKKSNKYTTPEVAHAAQDEVNEQLERAGLPVPTQAQLNQAQTKIGNDPRMQLATTALENAGQNPTPANIAVQTQKFGASVWSMAGSSNIDPWQLVVLAYKGAVEDQNATLQYDLSKLQMYGSMQTQMSAYGDVLQSTQTALDQKVHNGSDPTKAEVEMDDQRSYDSFGTTDADGVLHYTQMAVSNGPVGSSASTSSTSSSTSSPMGGWSTRGGAGADGKAPGSSTSSSSTGSTSSTSITHPDQLVPLGPVSTAGPKGEQGWKFGGPQGSTFTGYGTDEGAARLDAFYQEQQAQAQNPKTGGNLVSAQNLNLKVQFYTQQMEQLQKLITQWQNQYQSDSETKNQQISTVTSILKNMYDMQQNAVRNTSL